MIKPYYEEDNIQIYCGDCLEIMPQLEKVDLILTDSPYQARFQQGGGHFGDRDYFKSVNEGVGSSLNFEIRPYLETIYQTNKRPFCGYFWTSQRMVYDYLSFAKEKECHYDILVWAKTNPIPTKNNKYLPDLEYCVFIRESGSYFNNDADFRDYKKFMITGVNKSEYGHPTEKPLRVIIPSMRISCSEQGTILDPFLGSGTTLVACKELGRRGIGIEISKEYCDIAIKRLKNTQKDMFL